jgi:hypothetical protein
VAYRENYIGINTNDPNEKEDTVLAVHGSKGHNKIRLFPLKIDGNYSALMSIDLATGQLDGFVIDGGTWDEI